MICPRCGTANPDAERRCSACGLELPVVGRVGPTQPDETAPRPPSRVSPTLPDEPLSGSPGGAPSAKKTMLGIGAQPGAESIGHATMLGMGPLPSSPMPQAPAPPQPISQRRTMIGTGMPAPGAPGKQTLVDGTPTPVASGKQTLVDGTPAPFAPGKQTMLGVGALAVPPPPSYPTHPSAPAPSGLPSQQKTMLGIAHPGIAPLHPGQAKPASAPNPPLIAPAAVAPASRELSETDLSVLPGYGKAKHRRAPALVWIVLAGAGVLLAALAAIIAVFWKSASSELSARVSLAPDNREDLTLSCHDCPDGTTVALDGRTATFHGGAAKLVGIHTLAMGKNKLDISLQRPGASASSVDLVVPVEYRVRGDFSELGGDPPKLRVLVQALPKSSVIVDGHALALAPDGTAHYDIDVSHDLSGGAARVIPLQRSIAYIVTPPDSAPEHGTVKLQLGIVPLEVNAPGPDIVIDSPHFMLAGRTASDATVSVAGHPITVDPSGHFAQLMNVSSIGETTIIVRASAPKRAPRLFPILVKRVANLHDTAAAFEKHATTSYAAIASNIEAKAGWAVALQGHVTDVRVTDHVSVILLDVKRGCAAHPCLARLVFGENTELKSGDPISAFGHVTRAVDGPRSGTKIPEVRVEFILKGTSP